MIAKQDTNRFESLARLREYARFIRNVSCDGVINSIEEKPATSFSLSQNFPNPFHDQTSITFSLPNRAHVRLKIFDALGREVTTFVDEEREAGEHVVELDLKLPTISLPSGVYFYQLDVDGKKLMKKMLKVDFTKLY